MQADYFLLDLSFPHCWRHLGSASPSKGQWHLQSAVRSQAQFVLGGPGWPIPHFKPPHLYWTAWSCPLHTSFRHLALQLEQIFYFLAVLVQQWVLAVREPSPVWCPGHGDHLPGDLCFTDQGAPGNKALSSPCGCFLLCRGCSRGKAGSMNFVDSSYSPGAVSS